MAKKNNALRIVLIVVAVILVGAIGSGVWLIAYVSNPKNAFSELEGNPGRGRSRRYSGTHAGTHGYTGADRRSATRRSLRPPRSLR